MNSSAPGGPVRLHLPSVKPAPYWGRCNQLTPPMLKAVVKTVTFIVILFVMLYVGMNNTHQISFRFPVAGVTEKTPLHASAALIYFGMFAVGLLAGTILAVGSGGGRGSRKSFGKEK